jgi:hypothetical protein
MASLYGLKVFGRAAKLAGLTHAYPIEAILADSLRRHELMR